MHPAQRKYGYKQKYGPRFRRVGAAGWGHGAPAGAGAPQERCAAPAAAKTTTNIVGGSTLSACDAYPAAILPGAGDAKNDDEGKWVRWTPLGATLVWTCANTDPLKPKRLYEAYDQARLGWKIFQRDADGCSVAPPPLPRK